MSLPVENDYTPYHRQLLTHARYCLEYGVRRGKAPVVELQGLPEMLTAHRATFITLEMEGRLRGCIGHIEASQPLIQDIADNAVAAALTDPRFTPVQADEVDRISISISILTPPEPLTIATEEELIQTLRPGVDGLILQEDRRRATFLPSVWEELPEKKDFVRHLKSKAGWPPDYWSDGIKAFRYQSAYLSETGPPQQKRGDSPRPFRVQAHRGGFRPGIDQEKLNQLVDDLDAEDVGQESSS